MNQNEQDSGLEIPDPVFDKWQNIVDIMAHVMGIPAALIMRIVKNDIEVYVSSNSDGNPYNHGDHEHFIGSGLYC